MTLVVTAETLDAVRSHARATYPEECCGLLLDAPDARGAAAAVLEAENRHSESRHGFELAPEPVAGALARERRGGQSVVGVYHSHPDAEARPSASDERDAWPGWSYLIVPVTVAGCGEPRSFRRPEPGAPLREEPVDVVRGAMA